ncbi:MAG: hypothetical protein KC609_18640 [Myxococcales bacterium]|nr:hypothetical protein [Myxococcales bacterium]
MRPKPRSYTLSRWLFPGLMLLGFASCAGRCGSTGPGSKKPQFTRPLVDLVPTDALACVTIDNLTKVQEPIVHLVRRIVPQDADQWFRVARRLTAIDLTGKGFEPAGIRPSKGATLFVSRETAVLLLSIEDRGKFEAAVRQFAKLRGHRRWTKDPSGEIQILSGRTAKDGVLATLRYHQDVAIVALPLQTTAKPPQKLIAPPNAIGSFRTSTLWTRTPKDDVALRFALRSGGPVPAIVGRLLDGSNGTLRLDANRVSLRARFYVKSSLSRDLKSWFRLSSKAIPAQRIVAVKAPLRIVANLDFAQFSTIATVLRVVGVDLMQPLRDVWPKDPQLDLASELFRVLTGRAALFVKGLNIKLDAAPKREDDFPFVTWLRHTNFAVALQLANPKRAAEILQLATEVVSPHPSAPGKLARYALPKLALLRAHRLLLLRRIRGGSTVYELTSPTGKVSFGVLALRGGLLWVATSIGTLEEAIRAFERVPAQHVSPRERELLASDHLLAGLLDIKNLIQQLIVGGVPPGAMSTLRRITRAGFAISVHKECVELDWDIEL